MIIIFKNLRSVYTTYIDVGRSQIGIHIFLTMRDWWASSLILYYISMVLSKGSYHYKRRRLSLKRYSSRVTPGGNTSRSPAMIVRGISGRRERAGRGGDWPSEEFASTLSLRFPIIVRISRDVELEAHVHLLLSLTIPPEP